jgi:lipopolysaccharide transport system ATP-binding protein
VLLIDEVLAVGDARFQEKCLRYLREFRNRNGTLIIVSHNMKELAAICDEGLCLDVGQVAETGGISQVIESYAARMAAPGRMTARP